MWLDPQWMARGLDAMRAMLDVDAHTRKDMIQFLFDEGFWDSKTLTWPAAEARWNACMNPAKSAFWKPSELWALSVRFRRPQLLQAWAEDMGCELRPIPTEARRQALLERIATAWERAQQEVAACSAQLQRLPDLDNPAPPTRGYPPMQPGGKFMAPDDVDDTQPSGGF